MHVIALEYLKTAIWLSAHLERSAATRTASIECCKNYITDQVSRLMDNMQARARVRGSNLRKQIVQ